VVRAYDGTYIANGNEFIAHHTYGSVFYYIGTIVDCLLRDSSFL